MATITAKEARREIAGLFYRLERQRGPTKIIKSPYFKREVWFKDYRERLQRVKYLRLTFNNFKQTENGKGNKKVY